MAPRKPPFSLDRLWLCECCGSAHEGVDPPDECWWCGHTYFANMDDVDEITVDSTDELY